MTAVEVGSELHVRADQAYKAAEAALDRDDLKTAQEWARAARRLTEAAEVIAELLAERVSL